MKQHAFLELLSSPVRNELVTPFQWNGRDCATDGHVLLLVDGEPEYHGTGPGDCAKAIAGDRNPPFIVPFALLKAWSYPGVELDDCAECDADGDYYRLADRDALIFGTPLNTYLLFKALCLVSADSVAVETPIGEYSIRFTAPGWELHIMPLRLTSTDQKLDDLREALQ